jgi:2-dehydro-3-deoxy-D-gluconate 5-dehydrogenase
VVSGVNFGMFSLAGKAALVTGGNSGLGRDALHAMRGAGAKCFAVSRTGIDHATGAQLSAQECLVLDLKHEGAAAIALDAAENACGPIDVLVNSAGVSLMQRAETCSAGEIEELFSINLFAVNALNAEFVKRCRKRGSGGSIINVGSILAANAMRGAAIYGASKAALDQLTRVQALEWGRHGIRVNSIAPGWFQTPMTDDLLSGPAGALLRQKNPTGRLGLPGDLDGAVLLLASDAGRYITGSIITVDGGQHLVP